MVAAPATTARRSRALRKRQEFPELLEGNGARQQLLGKSNKVK